MPSGAEKTSAGRSTAPVAKKSSAASSVDTAKKATAPTSAKTKSDTLVVIARLTEIPGRFAPNDLYNYVYIMKYRVLSVEKGAYKPAEILVGIYNPLIPRNQIKDAIKNQAGGNATVFKTGVKHRLILITPIEKVWKDAVEDEYFDSELEKYYALRADIAP
ncbi:MAG: hypothetical protein MUF22_01760 [Chitinispirillaceae bacterium]|jgi:hypothetical protein|nr:hypothetical protein [Chitinispirillaceae bacterium]